MQDDTLAASRASSPPHLHTDPRLTAMVNNVLT